MSGRGDGYFETDDAAHYVAETVRVGPLPAEEAKARARRNVVIALGLLAFVVLVFVITIVKMQGGALTTVW